MEIETPRPRDRWIKDAHGTRRGAARIRKPLPASLVLRLVQIFEGLQWHDDLSAHFEIRGYAQFLQLRRIHAKRNRSDGTHIRCDVFAGRAVSARHAACEYSILVSERNTQAIELVFRDIIDAI